MVQFVKLNKKGFTLIEVIIALVIALLVFFALMQTALISIDSNMRNTLRDEAVSIAEMKMNEARNIPFATLVSNTTPEPVIKNFRNISNFQYLVTRTVIVLNADNKQVDILVAWGWKGDPYTFSITTIRKS